MAMLQLHRVSTGPAGSGCVGPECNEGFGGGCGSPNNDHGHDEFTSKECTLNLSHVPSGAAATAAAAAAAAASSSSSSPALSPSSWTLTPFVPNASAVNDAAAVAAAAASTSTLVSVSESARPPVIAADCHMLRAFSRDQDSWFALLHTKLNLSELAALYGSCRTCQGWIGRPSKLLLASKRARVVSPKALQAMAACKWVRPFLMQIQVNMRPALPASAAAAAAAGADGTATPPPAQVPPPLVSTLPLVVEALCCFPRLTRVGLQLCSMDAGRAEVRQCFQRLGRGGPQGLRIQHLELLMAGMGTMPPAEVVAAAAQSGDPLIPAVAAAFLELGALPHLECLSVSNLDEMPSGLNFEALTRLPALKQLAITISRGPASAAAAGASVHRSFHATAAQAKCLSQCKQLVNLRCGVWSLPQHLDQQLHLGAPTPEVLQRCKAVVDAGVGTLIGGKISALRVAHKELLALRAAPAPGSSARSSPDPVPSALPLQLLHLEGTVISSAVWAHLCQMHSLVSLTPYAWRSDLTPGQWAALARFRHLRAFSLLTHPLDAYGPRPITAQMVLPHLLQCTMIQTLHLQSVALSRAQLAEVVAKLPNLKHLSMRAMQIECVQPLAQAHKLQVLSLHFCTQPQPQPQPQPQTAAAPVVVAVSKPAASSPVSLDDDDAATVDACVVAAAGATEGVSPSSVTVPRVLSFRESLPSIPQLTALLLHDRVRITAEAAAPLNAALHRRLPKLKLSAFHQNLLAATPTAVAAVSADATAAAASVAVGGSSS